MHNIRLVLLWCLLLPFPSRSTTLNINGLQVGSNLGGGFDNVRFHFQFGLQEGVVIGTGDIEALVCRTEDYLEEVLYSQLEGQLFEVKATGINWNIAKDDDPLPIKMNFTAKLAGRNGTELASVPSPEKLREATQGLDMGAYLANVVQTSLCPSQFSQATKVEYEVNLAPDVKGMIVEPLCQTTCAPTLSPGTPTIAPTKFPTGEPSTIPPKETFLTDEHANVQLRPDRTRNPSADAPKPVSAINPAYLPPAHLAPTVMDDEGSPSDNGSLGGGGNGGFPGGGPPNSGGGSPGGGPPDSGGGSPGGGSGGSPAGSGGPPAGETPSGEQVSVPDLSSTAGASGGSSSGGGSSAGSSGSSGFGMGSSSSSGGSDSGGPMPIPSPDSSTPGSSPAGSDPAAGGPPGSNVSDSEETPASNSPGVDPSGSDPSTGGDPSSDGGGPSGGDTRPSGSGPSGDPSSAKGGTGPPGSVASSSDASGFGMGGSSNGGPGNGSAPGGTSSAADGGPESSITNPNHKPADTGHSDMILFNLALSFVEGKARELSEGVKNEPTLLEIKSLICYTQDFFANELAKVTGDPQISFQAIDIDWVQNGNSFELQFAANVTDAKSMPVPEDEVFQSLKVAQGDLQDYIYSYVWKVPAPAGERESVFYYVQEVDLRISQNVAIPLGQMPEGLSESCDAFQMANDITKGALNNPPSQHEAAESGHSDMILFTVSLGFFEGEEGEPTMSEIKSLICLTQDFFAHELNQITGDAAISFRAIDIDWVHNEDSFELTFAADVMDGQEMPMPEDVVFQSLKVAQGDLKNYITDFVWKAQTPAGHTESVFFHVGEVDLQTSQNVPIPSGQMPDGLQESCEAYEVASSQSARTERSFESFRSLPPKNEAEAGSDMILFTVTLSFLEGEEEEPFLSEIKSLICYTQDYFQDELTELAGDVGISFKAINIDWAYNESGSNVFELNFAANVMDGKEMPMFDDQVFQSLKVAKEDLKDYIVDYVWKAQTPAGHNESVFHNVAEVDLQTNQNVPIPPGQMPDGLQEDCKAYKTPTAETLGSFHPSSADASNTDHRSEYMVEFTLRIGFFEGSAQEPSHSEIESAVCAMNEYIKEDLRQSLQDNETEAIVYIVSETYAEGESKPVTVEFVVEGYFKNGTMVPAHGVYEALQLDSDDLVVLIEHYMWEAPPGDNVFRETSQMSFEAHIGIPEEVPESSLVVCPENATSSPEPSSGPQRDGAPLTTYRDGAFGFPGIPGGAANDDSPQEPPDQSDSLSASPPPPDSPTETMSRLSPSEEKTTADEQELSYNLVIGFYDDKEEPEQAEMEGLMCEVKNYFLDFLRSHLKEPDLDISITDIGWTYDEDCHTPLNVMFTIDATDSNGTAISSEEMFQTVKLGDDEIMDLIENYVWNSQPAGSPFSDVNELRFEESMGSGVSVPEGTIAEATCPETVAPIPGENRLDPFSLPKSEENQESDKAPELQPSYKLAFGFYEGKAEEPTKDEIEAMICQTNVFFEEKLKESTGDAGVEAHAVNICWDYTPDCSAPVTVAFGMEASFGTGETVPPEEVFEALKLEEGDMQVYIEEFVQKSSPVGSSVFSNANQLGFEDYLGGPMPEAQLAQASCPTGGGAGPTEPNPKEASPTEPSPEESSTSSPPGQSPSEQTGPNRGAPFSIPASDNNESPGGGMPTADATSENSILYHLEFNFADGTLEEPTTQEIAGFICETTAFFQGELEQVKGGECIDGVSLTKIDWTYADDCPTAPVTVTFAAQAAYCDGSEVPVEVIYGSMKLDQNDMKTYMEAYLWSLQDNVFSNAISMSFEGRLHATVRPGKIPGVVC